MNQDSMTSTKSVILVIYDMPSNRDILFQILEPQGYEILLATGGEIAHKVAAHTQPDLILLDILTPNGIDGFETCRRLKQDESTQDIPVIFVAAGGETPDVVEGLRLGGVDYITRPFEKEEVLVRVETNLKINRLTKQLSEKDTELQEANEQLRREIAKHEQAEDAHQKAGEQLDIISRQDAFHWGIDGIIGKSKAMAKILDEVRQLQSVDTTSVLITGESGTGKELVARAIHFGGTRKKGPFVPVNCSAIPGELAESTLFGHVRGAFTGATTNHQGCFKLADGGTLFLDEIGTMPLERQPKLLRALEDGCFTPVGSIHKRHVDVRILASTNANLELKIANGTFREDLYFRLARFTLTIPPLRERKEDIPLITEHFLRMFAAEIGREATLSQEALSALKAYHFPGNVRELKNIIEHALIRSGGSVIQPKHLHLIDMTETVESPTTPTDSRRTTSFSFPTELDSQQAETIIMNGALAQTEGDVEAAARLLGVAPTQIEEMIKTDTPYLPMTDEERILMYVRTRGSITNAECRDLLNVDANRASYLLKKMHRTGLLTRKNAHRWAQYSLPLTRFAVIRR